MPLHQLLLNTADARPESIALRHRGLGLNYAELADTAHAVASGLAALGIRPGDRVAIFLPKQAETVVAFFATSLAGGVFVPINTQLKPAQVQHVLHDSGATVLITTPDRAQGLADRFTDCPTLQHLVLVSAGDPAVMETPGPPHTIDWQQLRNGQAGAVPMTVAGHHLAAILYTSGSTGRPKGVALSHHNLLMGADSVSRYLENRTDDRILALLPFSFDYGLNQLTTAVKVGATTVLMEYLLPMDVLNTLQRESITGLAAIPALWHHLARLPWPQTPVHTLRYITNSGGAMPTATLRRLQEALPHTRVYLMYGLTEAFRSTYLDPAEVSRRPASIGKAIPHAEIAVIHPDGRACVAGETGELVHLGPLVAAGYWNRDQGAPVPFDRRAPFLDRPAVWSGDLVTTDADGFIYFVGRNDDMIKTAGHRVSPSDVEEVIYQSDMILECAVLGVPDPVLGQAIVAVVAPLHPEQFSSEALLQQLRRALPTYMVPTRLLVRAVLPRTPHGKIDRVAIRSGLDTDAANDATLG